MANLSVRVRYRPVRIGWCVRENNWEELRRALRYTNVLWGGKFNPIIPFDVPHADTLVRRFRIDVLVSISEDQQLNEFVSRFSH
jgi:hypothetical protein